MLSWSPRAAGTGAYLGCGMSPHLGAASDVQRVIELFVHLGSRGHTATSGSCPSTALDTGVVHSPVAAPAAECKETPT